MFAVLRANPSFRRLWAAQIVSQFGDWLNRIAILTLIGELGGGSLAGVTGVGALFGFELALRLLPPAMLGPLAGPVADRLPRRWVMFASDLARAAVVLCLLLIRRPEQLPWLYALVFAQTSIAIFFEAAKNAALPSTVPKRDLHAAYALSAASWSVLLSVGTLAGGVAQKHIGIQGVFLADAATFLASAFLVLGLRLPSVARHPERFRWRDVLLLTDLRRGLTHARARGVLPVLFAKSFWGPCGGFLVLLSVAGRVRFVGPGASVDEIALATGWLWSARGLGTGIGPVLARHFFGSSDRTLGLQIAFGFVVGAVGYGLFALTPAFWPALLCVVFAHAGGSALWVGSTLAWQRRVDDGYRGRVFTLESLGMTISFSLASLAAGAAYDRTGSFTDTLLGVCCAVVLSGVAWAIWAARSWRRSTFVEPA